METPALPLDLEPASNSKTFPRIGKDELNLAGLVMCVHPVRAGRRRH